MNQVIFEQYAQYMHDIFRGSPTAPDDLHDFLSKQDSSVVEHLFYEYSLDTEAVDAVFSSINNPLEVSDTDPEVNSTSTPEFIKPDSIKPDSIKPYSIKPDSIKPYSIKPDSIKPYSIKPQGVGVPEVEAPATSTFAGIAEESIGVAGGLAIAQLASNAVQAFGNAARSPEGSISDYLPAGGGGGGRGNDYAAMATHQAILAALNSAGKIPSRFGG